MSTSKDNTNEPRPEVIFISKGLETLPIGQFAKMLGWTRRKVESKIHRVWIEKKHYHYDPDGEIHINLAEYNNWTKSGPGSKRGKNQSKSGSAGKARESGKHSTGIQPLPTAKKLLDFGQKLRL
ncbi:hypothetical protein [Agarilytica rhodophyticola]|uniref:hypothetical protein n=1 Tax=Agarilytica rhodophyticola TaxID=1737490 RepID=UPI001FE6F39C|nr:hypothetical protein [Agarilytica rhodophyticola]